MTKVMGVYSCPSCKKEIGLLMELIEGRCPDREILAKLRAFMEKDIAYRVEPEDRTLYAQRTISRDMEIIQHLTFLIRAEHQDDA